MTVKLGGTDINKIYLGSTEIKKAYLGSTLVYDKTAPPSGGWSLNGSVLSTGAGQSSPVWLNSTTVALLNNTTDELQAYSWDGSTFTIIVSSKLSLGSIANGNRITRLAEDEIFVTTDGTGYKKYTWDGSSFSAVGGFLLNSGARNVAAGTSSTRSVCISGGGTKGIGMYDFDGSTWSLVGSIFVLTLSFQRHSVCVLDDTVDAERIVVYTDVDQQFTVYDFNGSTWTKVGTSLTPSVTGSTPFLSALSTSSFAYVNNSDNLIQYSFDGSTITAGGTIIVTGASAERIGDFGSGTVVWHDGTYGLASYTYTP